MKILTVVGARPQFIKHAAVTRALQAVWRVEEVLVHTGQHYDGNMSDVFFRELEIPSPDYHLGVGSGHHGAQTGAMLTAVEEVLSRECPDWVIVYGDTNSTLAGGLAAAKLSIPVAHVEAGLRSFNRRMPEELNRVLTDHLADLLFAPTKSAVVNLRAEGIAAEKIHLTGDVMYDASLYYARRAEALSNIISELDLSPQSYVLATVHRAENTDDPDRLASIFGGLGAVARQMPVVVPIHPRTRKAMVQNGVPPEMGETLRLIEPVGYLDMVELERNAAVIATDSGGVQKEAFFYRVPCVTLRAETEWTELVELGWNRIVEPRETRSVAEAIFAAVEFCPDDHRAPGDLYGGGNAAIRIVEEILSWHERRRLSPTSGVLAAAGPSEELL